MAQSDDLARAVAIMAGQNAVTGVARDMRRAAGLAASEVAKACGVTAETVTMWEDCLARPSLSQYLAWMSLLTDRVLAGKASYATQIRGGHAGSDRFGGGPAETTADGVTGLVEQLRQDFPAWEFPLPDGFKSIGAEKPPRLVWRAARTDERSHDLVAGTAWELRGKLGDVEAALERDDDALARYNDGRGVTRRTA